MKIAVTSQNRKTVTGHAGKCRKFWIYDVENKKVIDKALLELPIEQSFHESHGAGPHPLDDIDALISGGMGNGLLNRLKQMGISGCITLETNPDLAVTAYIEGRLDCRAQACETLHRH